MWELEVPLAKGRFDDEADVCAMVDAFHRVHDRVFAVSEPEQYIECIYWKGRATVRLPKPHLHRLSTDDTPQPVPARVAPTWFGGDRPRETPRYFGMGLATGQVIEGPAIIEEPTTTVVVYPHWTAHVAEFGNYLLTRERT